MPCGRQLVWKRGQGHVYSQHPSPCQDFHPSAGRPSGIRSGVTPSYGGRGAAGTPAPRDSRLEPNVCFPSRTASENSAIFHNKWCKRPPGLFCHRHRLFVSLLIHLVYFKVNLILCVGCKWVDFSFIIQTHVLVLRSVCYGSLLQRFQKQAAISPLLKMWRCPNPFLVCQFHVQSQYVSHW